MLTKYFKIYFCQELHKNRQHCLMEQLKYLRLLSRQGFAFRNSTEDEGNLNQLLKNSSLPDMKKYLLDGHYLSHHINSELIKEMYRTVLNDLLKQIKAAQFYAIVIDETRDIAGMWFKIKY